MSNEELERKMAFIVARRAQFQSDMQRLQRSQTQTRETVAEATEMVVGLINYLMLSRSKSGN